jgi:hypothetical protein
MSSAGPGLSPSKQAATSKVSPTNAHGDTVTQGYLAGTRNPPKGGNSQMFKTNQPHAQNVDTGSGGPISVGGRNVEPKDMMRGKGNKYTPPRWG